MNFLLLLNKNIIVITCGIKFKFDQSITDLSASPWVSTWVNILCILDTFWTIFWMFVDTPDALLLKSEFSISL